MLVCVGFQGHCCSSQIHYCPDTGMMEQFWVPVFTWRQAGWFEFCKATGRSLLRFASQDHISHHSIVELEKAGDNFGWQPYLRSISHRISLSTVCKALEWSTKAINRSWCWSQHFSKFPCSDHVITSIRLLVFQLPEPQQRCWDEILQRFVQNDGVYRCMWIE